MSKAGTGKSRPASVPSSAGTILLNIPNLLTAARILLIPVFVLVYLAPTPLRSLWAASIFALASATDLLDGYFARKMEQVTRLGKLMDPIADKLLVLSALILLVQFQTVPAILAILIVGREIVITGMRLIAANQGIIIPAERLGKFKTVLQVAAIMALILDPSVLRIPPEANLHTWGRLGLWVSLALALISAYQYISQYSLRVRKKD